MLSQSWLAAPSTLCPLPACLAHAQKAHASAGCCLPNLRQHCAPCMSCWPFCAQSLSAASPCNPGPEHRPSCHHIPGCCRLRWNVGHVHLLCYYFPWQREDLTFTCKASYIIGYYAWALAQVMMGILGILIFSWIAFRECHLIVECWLHTSAAVA